MLSEKDTKRLEIVRFPLILLVLYIHSLIVPVNYGSGPVELQASPALVVFNAALSEGVARIAVPMFFLMSGYLFFVGFTGTLDSYRAKIRNRVGTLLIPYLFWNGLVAIVFIMAQSLPQTASYFKSEQRLIDTEPLVFIDTLLGITQHPIAYQFWFVRDLMILAVLALPIHIILTRSGWVLPLLLLFVWYTHPPAATIPSIEAATWFVIGAALALRGKSLFAWERRLTWFGPIYMILLAGDLMLRIDHDIWWLRGPAITIGLLTALCLPQYALRNPRLTRILVTLSPASFFVFAAHEPMMAFARKLLYRILPPTSPTVLCVYVLLPLLIAAITLASYFILKRLAPGFISLVGGNRVTSRS